LQNPKNFTTVSTTELIKLRCF